jgi:hypothetical protein
MTPDFTISGLIDSCSQDSRRQSMERLQTRKLLLTCLMTWTIERFGANTDPTTNLLDNTQSVQITMYDANRYSL